LAAPAVPPLSSCSPAGLQAVPRVPPVTPPQKRSRTPLLSYLESVLTRAFSAHELAPPLNPMQEQKKLPLLLELLQLTLPFSFFTSRCFRFFLLHLKPPFGPSSYVPVPRRAYPTGHGSPP